MRHPPARARLPLEPARNKTRRRRAVRETAFGIRVEVWTGMEHRERSDWTAQRFFDLLSRLGRVRIISVCGPSVFEALCEVETAVERGGFLNIMTDAYHWHFSPGRFRALRSVDALHKRSNRRAVYFELFEDASCEGTPFLRIYLFRPHGQEFCPDSLAEFEAAHKELSQGIHLEGVPR